MPERPTAPLSRREWLERMAGPVAAASVATALLPSTAVGAGSPSPADAGKSFHDIRDHGAVGDGATLDTAAVQAAIDACHANRGGTVLVPAGTFVVGTLELKSNVTLHLAPRGRLLGSEKIEDYHAGNGIPPSNGNVVLLSAAAAENITIEGGGTIDGNGAKFFTGRGDATGPGDDRSRAYVHRPHLLVFHRCENLRMRDVFLTASAYHCVRVLQCRNVHFHDIRIHNRVNRNNDGFHLVGNQYVHIADCDVLCQDDACALFGSNRFVTVANCSFSTRWSVFRFGGGEPGDITITNCVIYETYGCPIKMAFGRGSRAEDIMFSNLVMRDVTGPITVGLGSRPRRSDTGSDERPPGVVRNISFRGIRATVVDGVRPHADLPFPSVGRPGETRTCIVLNGAGEAVLENISLSDVHATFAGGGTAEEAAVRDVPAIAGEYFEIGTPPAYGIYARAVLGLTLHNIRLETASPDRRPAVVFDHVRDASINGLSAQGNLEAESLLRFIDTADTLLTAARVLTPAAVFLQLEGEDNAAITVDGGDLHKAAQAATFVRGATASVLRLRI